MKRSEIAMIVLVAGLSVIVAYFAANTLIGKPTTQDAKVRTIDSITSTVTEPDTKVFNKEAINPTVEVNIGDE
jgi:hypothetical protein